MVKWRIHYSDGFVDGFTREEWVNAPDFGVQVIVLFREPDQFKGELRWTGVTDRLLWTGVDEYDPFGWGVKYGLLLPDEDYWRIWGEAKTCPS